jgi:TRAP-type C4-dicarboxylate transport system permease small subunit
MKKLKWIGANWPLVISATALGCACIVTFVNVIVRYFFTKFVLVGAEELTTVFISWTIFVGAAAAYKHGMMFGIDIIVKYIPRKFADILNLFINILVLTVAVYVSYLAWNFSNAAWIRTTANMRIPYFWLDIPIFIGFTMISYYSAKELINKIYKMVKKRDLFKREEDEAEGGDIA